MLYIYIKCNHIYILIILLMIYKSEIIMQKTEGFLQPAPFIVGDCNGVEIFWMWRCATFRVKNPSSHSIN